MAALLIVLLIKIDVFAFADSDTFDKDAPQGVPKKVESVEIPIYENYQDMLKDFEENDGNEIIRAGGAIMTPKLYRSSSGSTVVQLYMKYLGTEAINAASFTNIKIRNTSSLNPVNITSTGYTYVSFSAISSGQFKVANVIIPTSYTKVRVLTYGGQVYSLVSGWVSATNGNWITTIQ